MKLSQGNTNKGCMERCKKMVDSEVRACVKAKACKVPRVVQVVGWQLDVLKNQPGIIFEDAGR